MASMDRQAIPQSCATGVGLVVAACRHQEQKHMLNVSSPSAECLQLEDEIG